MHTDMSFSAEVASFFEPSVTSIIKIVDEQRFASTSTVSVSSCVLVLHVLLLVSFYPGGFPRRWLCCLQLAFFKTAGAFQGA